MMTIAEMKKRKKELGYTNKKIAEETGIPLGTIQKIFAGVTGSPRWEKMQALESLLSEKSDQAGCSETAPVCLREEIAYEWSMPDDRDPSGGADSRQGRYTVEDYLAMPEDRRVELIDGVFYDMVAPSAFHQLILGHLSYQFRECAREHDKACEVLMAPFDVRLDMDNYTMVQPDLLVICHELDYMHLKRLEGAPDLAVEILSPSSRSKDMFLKLYKYQNAGVREYWIVDPENQTVTVHLLEDDEHYEPKKYSFQDCIPVGISDGTCSISLSELMERLSGYRS